LCRIELWKLQIVCRYLKRPCYALNQGVHCLLGLPNKNNMFCNRTCLFIWLTYILNAKSKQATHWHMIFIWYSYHIHPIFTHDIQWISVFQNQGVHHGKHWHQPFQKCAQVFVGLQFKIFSHKSFTLTYQNFLTLSLHVPVYQNTHWSHVWVTPVDVYFTFSVNFIFSVPLLTYEPREIFVTLLLSWI